jgi:hypothetical protein
MTFEPDQGIFAKQLRQLGVSLTWVRSPTTGDDDGSQARRPALYGSYAVVDFNKDSSEAAKAFAAKYEATPDIFASWAYDAVHVLARAIGEAKSLEPEKLRQAILATKGYAGAEGERSHTWVPSYSPGRHQRVDAADADPGGEELEVEAYRWRGAREHSGAACRRPEFTRLQIQLGSRPTAGAPEYHQSSKSMCLSNTMVPLLFFTML